MNDKPGRAAKPKDPKIHERARGQLKQLRDTLVEMTDGEPGHAHAFKQLDQLEREILKSRSRSGPNPQG